MEVKGPVLGAIYCRSLLIWPLPVFGSKFEQKWRFYVLMTAKTTTLRAPFKRITSASNVLHAIAKKKEHLYEYSACLSQLQSPLPVDSK